MMRLRQLDPDYARSRKHAWKKAVRMASVLVALMWLVWAIDSLTPFVAQWHSIYPRHTSALPGILFAPLLHSNFAHLVSNSLPVFLAILALFGNYPKVAWRVLVLAWLGTGTLVWLVARPSWHLGASGVLYALLSFLLLSGFLRRDMQSVGISLALVFLYGGFVFGVIPDKPGVSWESHLGGVLMGIGLAWWLRHEDRPVFRHYDLSDDWVDEAGVSAETGSEQNSEPAALVSAALDCNAEKIAGQPADPFRPGPHT